jgi:mannose-6-phosphate isomerase-like protein (cupin superfamily)
MTLPLITAVAQAPQGIAVFKADNLKGYTATLAPRASGAAKLATQSLANFGPSHNGLMVYRAGNGEAEYHEGSADFMVVEAGSCQLILGGTVKDGHSTGAGEIRGTSIDGGQTYDIAPGDIVNIPAKTPHQVIMPAGGSVTYFLAKISAK